MFLSIFMILAAMAGGGYLLKLSDENHEEAAFAYGLLGLIWVAGCFGLAMYFFPH